MQILKRIAVLCTALGYFAVVGCSRDIASPSARGILRPRAALGTVVTVQGAQNPFGVQLYNLVGSLPNSFPAVMDSVAAANIGWDRTAVAWCKIEPDAAIWSDTNSEMQTLEQQARLASERGISLLINVIFATPTWAGGMSPNCGNGAGDIPPDASHYQAWADYVYHLVSVLSQPPYNVHYYSIGNEVNATWNVSSYGPWLTGYDTLFKLAAQQIHAADPSGRAVAYELATSSDKSDENSIASALASDPVLNSDVDVIALHSYSSAENIYHGIDSSAAIRFPSKEVWLTEAGWANYTISGMHWRNQVAQLMSMFAFRSDRASNWKKVFIWQLNHNIEAHDDEFLIDSMWLDDATRLAPAKAYYAYRWVAQRYFDSHAGFGIKQALWSYTGPNWGDGFWFGGGPDYAPQADSTWGIYPNTPDPLWVYDGAASGTVGRGLETWGFQFHLAPLLKKAGMSVCSRSHEAWSGWGYGGDTQYAGVGWNCNEYDLNPVDWDKTKDYYIQALDFIVENPIPGLDSTVVAICAQAQVQGIGWQSAHCSPRGTAPDVTLSTDSLVQGYVGTTGQSRRLEALKLWLDMSSSVSYFPDQAPQGCALGCYSRSPAPTGAIKVPSLGRSARRHGSPQ